MNIQLHQWREAIKTSGLSVSERGTRREDLDAEAVVFFNTYRLNEEQQGTPLNDARRHPMPAIGNVRVFRDWNTRLSAKLARL